jgi:hypothetical protein
MPLYAPRLSGALQKFVHGERGLTLPPYVGDSNTSPSFVHDFEKERAGAAGVTGSGRRRRSSETKVR